MSTSLLTARMIVRGADSNRVYETITINYAPGRVRREKFNGVDYLVANLSLVVPGVLAGSMGPLYYPPSEVSRNPYMWNGMPLVVNHPFIQGKPVSARSPRVLEKYGIGFVFNTSFKNGKLGAEGWFDINRTNKIDRRIIANLEKNQPIELSTGLFTTNRKAPFGAHFNGTPYTHIAVNHQADHVAILPDDVGACSIREGCGVLINSLQKIRSTTGKIITNGKWVTTKKGQHLYIGKGGVARAGGPNGPVIGGGKAAGGSVTAPSVGQKITTADVKAQGYKLSRQAGVDTHVYKHAESGKTLFLKDDTKHPKYSPDKVNKNKVVTGGSAIGASEAKAKASARKVTSDDVAQEAAKALKAHKEQGTPLPKASEVIARAKANAAGKSAAPKKVDSAKVKALQAGAAKHVLTGDAAKARADKFIAEEVGKIKTEGMTTSQYAKAKAIAHGKASLRVARAHREDKKKDAEGK